MANLIKFEQIPFSYTFIHCLGKFKQNRRLCEQIELRLCDEFPEYYEQIVMFLKSKSILNTEKYLNYKKAKAIFSHCKHKEDIFNIPLTLSPDIKIEHRDNLYYLIDGKKKIRLKNWGKILLFFYGKYLTPADLLNNFMNSEIGKNFTYEDAKDNIISLITYYSLYYNSLIIES